MLFLSSFSSSSILIFYFGGSEIIDVKRECGEVYPIDSSSASRPYCERLWFCVCERFMIIEMKKV